MFARPVGVLLLAAVWIGAASAAGGPEQSLVRAVEKSGQVTSASISVHEQIKAGGKTVSTLRISGVERPKAQEGSFRYHASPAQTGLGDATIIVRGAAVYVHYPAFDTLAATNPAVKKWLLIDTKTSLGFNPTGLASLGTKEIHDMTGLATAGRGSAGRVPVTWYRGTLALSKISESAQMQSLLSSLPSEVSSLLRGTERMRVGVGRDGLIHGLSATIDAPMSDGTLLEITIDAELSGYGRSNRPIAAPARRRVMTVAQFQKATGSAPSAADTALLDHVVLAAADIGAGYRRSVIPGGRLVQGETTLDFCSLTYPSESLRSGRLQVAFDAGGSRPAVSNEVVTYDADGAQLALAEVRKAVTTCRNGRIAGAANGVKNLTRHFHTVAAPGLLPGAVAIVQTETADVNGKHVSNRAALVYQVRGNVLSAVYATGDSPAVVRKAALHAAGESAARLRKNVGAGDIR